MSCLSSTVRTEKEAELATLEAQLVQLNAAYSAAADPTGISSYRFDSGEGSQQAKLRPLNEIMDSIRFTQSRINRLRGELRGTGVYVANLRRRH